MTPPTSLLSSPGSLLAHLVPPPGEHSLAGDVVPMTLVYGVFLGFLAVMLAIDLGVLNRKAHVIGASEALFQASMWAFLAMAFSVVIYFAYDSDSLPLKGHAARMAAAAVEPVLPGAEAGPARPNARLSLIPGSGAEAWVMFVQGYLVELTLSLDNMMVIAMIFSYFAVPRKYQHRVLFWGIAGAVVMRGLMIGVGATLVHQFEWMLYVFGAVLILSAIKLLRMHEQAPDLERNFVVRAARAVMPVTPQFQGSRFFARIDGRLAATPLFLALLVVEFSDVIFAVDSIPAIFGITIDPFLVLTSNCFAILGLRAIYFAVAALVAKFRYLKVALIVVLIFIGIKMMLPLFLEELAPALLGVKPIAAHLSPYASLGIVAGILGIGTFASLAVRGKGNGDNNDSPVDLPSDPSPAPVAPAPDHPR